MCLGTCDGWMKNIVLAPAFIWVSTPCDSWSISLAQDLIHYLPLGPCLRVPYSYFNPVEGSMTEKASAIFTEAIYLVVEDWFDFMQKNVFSYSVLYHGKSQFFLLR